MSLKLSRVYQESQKAIFLIPYGFLPTNKFLKMNSSLTLKDNNSYFGIRCYCKPRISRQVMHKQRSETKTKFAEILSLSDSDKVYNRRTPIRKLTFAKLRQLLESDKDIQTIPKNSRKIETLWDVIFDLRNFLKFMENEISHSKIIDQPQFSMRKLDSSVKSYNTSLSNIHRILLVFTKQKSLKKSGDSVLLDEIVNKITSIRNYLDIISNNQQEISSEHIASTCSSLVNETNRVNELIEELLSQQLTTKVADTILIPVKDSTTNNSYTHTFPGDDFELKFERISTLQPYFLGDENKPPQNLLPDRTLTSAASEDITNEDSNEKHRCLSLLINLRCYLDLCTSLGMIKKAQLALHFFKPRLKNVDESLIEIIDLYNIILEALCLKNNFNEAKKWFAAIMKEGLTPNVHSFASLLHCIGSNNEESLSSYKELICEIVQQMKSLGLSVDDIFCKHVFITDQWQTIIKAIQVVEPGFTPALASHPLDYNCDLLRDLNDEGVIKAGPVLEGLVSPQKMIELTQKQIDMERNGYVPIKSILKLSDQAPSTLKELVVECENAWNEALKDALNKSKQSVKLKDNKSYFSRGLTLYPFLCAISEDTLVEVMLQEIRNIALGSETYSQSTTIMSEVLGSRVASRYSMNCKEMYGHLERTKVVAEDFLQFYYDHNLTKKYNQRQYMQFLIDNNPDGPLQHIPKVWPPGICTSLGSFLYELMIKHCKIDNNLFNRRRREPLMNPIFFKIIRYSGNRHKEEFKPHPVLSKLYRLGAKDTLMFEACELPMVAPPLPWTTTKSGGYLFNHVDFIRIPTRIYQHRAMIDQTPNQNLYPIFDSLSQLQCVPWKINAEILDVVIEIFNNKGNMDLDIPTPLSEIPLPPPMTESMTLEERKEIIKARMEYRKERSEMYSLWCSSLYQLSIANHFRDKFLWFPYNLDFRGRVYPCPPHFNHLGGDVSRSLLVFAKGEPLGEKGLNWLKTHLINLTGKLKREPISARKKYCDEIIADITDSADNPLTGKKWWMESDEPWQTLAACKELTKALRSGDPTGYISHLPIHQDGSCNGLQHYAALGRDEEGGASVNLIPNDRPQDVYNSVAVLVEKERAKDAADGLEIAILLDGYIQRKVIKQTVMTTVYGVTYYGARLQIAKQLKEFPGFPKEKIWAASLYLVNKTFLSLQKMFTATREIQDWFTECARLISGVGSQSVQWVTPLGLPIIQPYYRNAKLTNAARLAIRTDCPIETVSQPNTMKQKNGFPPNYIHSLDASHMMLTSLYCQAAGITFISVHDCFWTHANTVDIMNKICREQFVNLHSLPLLDILSEYMVDRFSYDTCDLRASGSIQEIKKRKLNRILVDVPKKGNLDLNQVLHSTYFFS